MIRKRPLLLAALFLASAGCGREPEAEGPPPRPEHPRPDFERADWLTLNGRWEYQPESEDGEAFGETVAVPAREAGAYRRTVEAPEGWRGKRVWLRFEAAGERAEVWLDGEAAGRHQGAFVPFEFDVTDKLPPGGSAELTVRTSAGGLSQTVWLEARPATYLGGLFLIPRHEGEKWLLEAQLELAGAEGSAQVEIVSTEAGVPGAAGQANLSDGEGSYSATFAISEPRLWTPETPNLYPLTVRVTGAGGVTDEVQTYFGLRTAGRGHAVDSDQPSQTLNGSPLYLRGLADGPNAGPPATDDASRLVLEQAKQLGFNWIGMQLETQEARRLYWADKIGMLVLEVLPECGEPSKACREIILRDRNHPSLLGWNAGQGAQQDLDPTRPLGAAALPKLSSTGTAGFRIAVTLQRRRNDSNGYVMELSRLPGPFGYDAFLDGMTPADLQGADFIGFEGPPLIQAAPGEKLSITPFVSHFSQRTEPPTLETKLTAVNDLGGRVEFLGKPRKVKWESYGVTKQEPIVMTSPDIRNYTGAVTFELEDAAGNRIAANFVNIVLRGSRQGARVEQVTPRRTALRADPASFVGSGWSAQSTEISKLWATGAGRAEYRFDVPADVLAAGVNKFELLAEVSTREAANGLVRVSLAGEPMGEVELPGDPKDAQGMLSPDGGHGYLLHLELTPDPSFLERLQRDGALVLAFEVPGGRAAGLTIYGEQSGRYPLDVTLIVDTERAVYRVEPNR